MKNILTLSLSIFILGFISTEKLAYDKVKTLVKTERNIIHAKWMKAMGQNKPKLLNEASECLYNSIVNKLIPYWYGTDWDFNGYTANPREGKIACGYFVSTVLLHSGLNLNRYKIAQKHSFEEVKLYSCGESVTEYTNSTRETFIQKFKETHPDGLYILGLNNHIGFLLHENDNIYFIHSNYRNPSNVVKERAEHSAALEDSDRFMLTAITNNQALVEKWILNQKIG